jgi:hypothetical protein
MINSGSFRWLAAVATLGAAVVLGVACGSDPVNTGSSSNNNDCFFGGQKCAAGCSETLGCIECSADSMCGAGSPLCVLGRCEACKSSADCGTGQTCYPRDFTCHPACTVNGDCPGDAPICEPNTGVCVGCLSNVDCAGTGQPVCHPDRRQCTECATNLDCGAADPVCDLQNGECEECLVDGHCPAGSLCGTDEKCHSACTSNLDCNDPAKPVCDIGSKDCVECLGNSDCGAAEPFCDGRNCRLCIVNADCPNPATPVCRDNNKCVECVSNLDCKDILQPICKDEQCFQCDKDGDCNDPAFPKCQNQVCSPP